MLYLLFTKIQLCSSSKYVRKPQHLSGKRETAVSCTYHHIRQQFLTATTAPLKNKNQRLSIFKNTHSSVEFTGCVVKGNGGRFPV